MRGQAVFLAGVIGVSWFAAVSTAQGQAALTASGPNDITNTAVLAKVSADGREFAIAANDGREVLGCSSSIALEGARSALSRSPQANTLQSDFSDDRGAGAQLVTQFAGLAGKPD